MRRRLLSVRGRNATSQWQVGTLADAMRGAMAAAQTTIDGSGAASDPTGTRRPVLIAEVSMTVAVVTKKGAPPVLAPDIPASHPVTSVERGRWCRLVDRFFGRVVQPVIISVRRDDIEGEAS